MWPLPGRKPPPGVHEGSPRRELCEASEGGALGLFSSKAPPKVLPSMREHSDRSSAGESSPAALVGGVQRDR